MLKAGKKCLFEDEAFPAGCMVQWTGGSQEKVTCYLFCSLWQNPDGEIWQNVDPDLFWACASRNLLSPKEFNFLTFSFYIPRVILCNVKSELLNKIFQMFMSYFKWKYCIGRKGNRCWRYKVSITPNWSLTVVINIDLMMLLPKCRVNTLAKIFL